VLVVSPLILGYDATASSKQKTSNFVALWRHVMSEPHQTWHGDRRAWRGQYHSCTSRTSYVAQR